MSGMAESTMGKVDPTQPVTKADKDLSKAHRKTRKLVDKIPDTRQKLVVSNHFNLKHGVQHLDRIKDNMKSLVKLGKKRAKALSHA